MQPNGEAMNRSSVAERHVLASCMKNEGPFVIEFVAHHIECGFTDIYVASNPSDDGTNELLSSLDRNGYIKHLLVATPQGVLPQVFSFERLLPYIDLKTTDWLMRLDADEFLNIRLGSRTVQELTGSVSSDVDIISVNWACFGDFPEENWRPGDSKSLFVYRLKSVATRNGTGKSLVRNPARFGSFGNHGPSNFKHGRPTLVALHAGLSTITIEDDHELIRKLRYPGSGPYIHSLAQINHYMIRTWDSFQLRIDRGRGMQKPGQPNSRHTEKYFQLASKARFLDDSILSYRDRTEKLASEMLAIPDIRFAYSECVRLHREKIGRISMPLSRDHLRRKSP